MKYTDANNIIIEEINKTLDSISENEVLNLVKQIDKADKVFFVGVGRVLLSLKSVAKRLAHLGVNAIVVGEITEPAITENDLLVVASGSGESAYPLIIGEKAKGFKATVFHIGSNPNSSMEEFSDYFLRIPVQTKLNLSEEIKSIQPMTSLFEQSLLLLGDIVSLMISKNKNINIEELWEYHANLE